MRRIAIVLTDGLRPDAIVPWHMPSLASLARDYTRAANARTVRPSATVAVLADFDAGLVFVYLPDCDRAGHAHGWMSAPYLAAAAEVDVAIGILAACAGDTPLVIVADHGGGGVRPREHDDPHPVNDWIPMIFAGDAIERRRVIGGPTSLLDLPPTILWWLGVPVPKCYEGRVLHEVFGQPAHAVEVVA